MKKESNITQNNVNWILLTCLTILVLSVINLTVVSEQKPTEVDYDKILNMTSQHLWESDITCKEEQIVINETINKSMEPPAFIFLGYGESLACDTNVTATKLSTKDGITTGALEGVGMCNYTNIDIICKTRSGRTLWSSK